MRVWYRRFISIRIPIITGAIPVLKRSPHAITVLNVLAGRLCRFRSVPFFRGNLWRLIGLRSFAIRDCPQRTAPPPAVGQNTPSTDLKLPVTNAGHFAPLLVKKGKRNFGGTIPQWREPGDDSRRAPPGDP